jgi:hypothetical protein
MGRTFYYTLLLLAVLRLLDIIGAAVFPDIKILPPNF